MATAVHTTSRRSFLTGAAALPAALMAVPAAAQADPVIVSLAERLVAASDRQEAVARDHDKLELAVIRACPERPAPQRCEGLDGAALNAAIFKEMAAHRDWLAKRAGIEASMGLPASEARLAQAEGVVDALFAELCSTPARDLASLIVKARVIDTIDCNGELSDSVVADLLAMA